MLAKWGLGVFGVARWCEANQRMIGQRGVTSQGATRLARLMVTCWKRGLRGCVVRGFERRGADERVKDAAILLFAHRVSCYNVPRNSIMC